MLLCSLPYKAVTQAVAQAINSMYSTFFATSATTANAIYSTQYERTTNLITATSGQGTSFRSNTPMFGGKHYFEVAITNTGSSAVTSLNIATANVQYFSYQSFAIDSNPTLAIHVYLGSAGMSTNISVSAGSANVTKSVSGVSYLYSSYMLGVELDLINKHVVINAISTSGNKTLLLDATWTYDFGPMLINMVRNYTYQIGMVLNAGESTFRNLAIPEGFTKGIARYNQYRNVADKTTHYYDFNTCINNQISGAIPTYTDEAYTYVSYQSLLRKSLYLSSGYNFTLDAFGTNSTEDFAVEFTTYITSVGSYTAILDGPIAVGINSDYISIVLAIPSGGRTIAASYAMYANMAYHICIERISGMLYVRINGKTVTQVANSDAINTSAFVLGGNYGVKYITAFRAVRGDYLYGLSNFQPSIELVSLYNKVIPVMTSDTTTELSVSTLQGFDTSTNPAYKAMDGVANTYAKVVNANAILELVFSEAKTVRGISIISASSVYYATSWKLQYYDGTQFVDAVAKSGNGYKNSINNKINIFAPVTATMFRIVVLGFNSSYCQLSEVQLYN